MLSDKDVLSQEKGKRDSNQRRCTGFRNTSVSSVRHTQGEKLSSARLVTASSNERNRGPTTKRAAAGNTQGEPGVRARGKHSKNDGRLKELLCQGHKSRRRTEELSQVGGSKGYVTTSAREARGRTGDAQEWTFVRIQ